jgi:hypothetical protein
MSSDSETELDTETEIPNCPKCKGDQFLDLCSKAADGNTYTLRRGKESVIKEGFMPIFQGLTNSDGCCLTVCLGCGDIKDLKVKLIRRQVKEAFKDDIQSGGSINDDESQEEGMTRITKKKQKAAAKRRAKTAPKAAPKPAPKKPAKKSGSKTAKKKPQAKSAKNTNKSKSKAKPKGKTKK